MGAILTGNAWVVINTETKKYHAHDEYGQDFMEVSDPMRAWFFDSEEDAIEARDELCFMYCDSIWCQTRLKDQWASLDKYLPEGWDWSRDGEITEGKQLSGPFQVKRFTYQLEE